jgi:hypothetical protein
MSSLLIEANFCREYIHYSQTGCSLASNIAILSHNIAILIGRLLRAICNRHEQISTCNSQKFCKQSLWLDYKKGGSTNPVAQTIWLASLFHIIQSEALFTNLLWISNLQFVRVGCKLLRAIYNLWQYRLGQSSFHMHSVVIYHFLIHFSTLPPPTRFNVGASQPDIRFLSDQHWTGGTGGAIPFKLHEITAAVP